MRRLGGVLVSPDAIHSEQRAAGKRGRCQRRMARRRGKLTGNVGRAWARSGGRSGRWEPVGRRRPGWPRPPRGLCGGRWRDAYGFWPWVRLRGMQTDTIADVAPNPTRCVRRDGHNPRCSPLPRAFCPSRRTQSLTFSTTGRVLSVSTDTIADVDSNLASSVRLTPQPQSRRSRRGPHGRQHPAATNGPSRTASVKPLPDPCPLAPRAPPLGIPASPGYPVPSASSPTEASPRN
jgi:hypothetical protein